MVDTCQKVRRCIAAQVRAVLCVVSDRKVWALGKASEAYRADVCAQILPLGFALGFGTPAGRAILLGACKVTFSFSELQRLQSLEQLGCCLDGPNDLASEKH